MTALMGTGLAVGMTRMDMSLILGSMLTARASAARSVGTALHLVMGTVVFGLAYAALWWAFDVGDAGVGTGSWFGLAVGTGWWFGLAVGAAHALIAACAMPMMSAVHPRAGATAGPRGCRAPAPDVWVRGAQLRGGDARRPDRSASRVRRCVGPRLRSADRVSDGGRIRDERAPRRVPPLRAEPDASERRERSRRVRLRRRGVRSATTRCCS
jgi:hypothetical protein